MKKYILDTIQITKKLERMALEIAERNTDADHIILAGIRGGGSTIAMAMLPVLAAVFEGQINTIEIALNKKLPDIVTLQPAINCNGAVVIIVDDVANSGRTITYALKPFLKFYPSKIQTLVLVERMHKAFPIQADYVGLSVATTSEEHICVEIKDEEVTGAYLI